MEEEKLLRVLILTLTNLISINALANQSDQEWANSIAERDRRMFVDNLKDMLQEQKFEQDIEALKPRPVLQIFVSTAMPKQLLKAYAREASRYKGALVFRGLPSGSFMKLTDLVMEISDEKHPCAMQIDDEAFKAFGIKRVPTIVLSKPASMFDQQAAKGKFDKVQGNITIKGALELFASNGDLTSNARGMLK